MIRICQDIEDGERFCLIGNPSTSSDVPMAEKFEASLSMVIIYPLFIINHVRLTSSFHLIHGCYIHATIFHWACILGKWPVSDTCSIKAFKLEYPESERVIVYLSPLAIASILSKDLTLLIVIKLRNGYRIFINADIHHT